MGGFWVIPGGSKVAKATVHQLFEERAVDLWLCVSACLSVSQEDWRGWACSYRGAGAAISPVKQKRGMFHHFCVCRVALPLSYSQFRHGVALFRHFSILWVWLIFCWEQHGLDASRAAFSPGFMYIYLPLWVRRRWNSYSRRVPRLITGTEGL